MRGFKEATNHRGRVAKEEHNRSCCRGFEKAAGSRRWWRLPVNLTLDPSGREEALALAHRRCKESPCEGRGGAYEDVSLDLFSL